MTDGEHQNSVDIANTNSRAASEISAGVQYVADESVDDSFPEHFRPTGSATDQASLAPVSALERLIGQLLQQLNYGRGFEALLDSIYDQLLGIVPYNRIAVAIFEDNPARLRLISCRSDGDVSLKTGYASRLSGSTLQPLMVSGHARIINDLETYFLQKPQSSSTRLILSEGMRSNLTLPLLADGKPIGVVFFSSRSTHVYTRQHAALLRRLAAHIAISVEKARWVEDLKESNQRLAEANQTKDHFLDILKDEVDRQTDQIRMSENRYRILVRLGQLVNSSLDVHEVFQSAAVEIHKLLECRLVTLRLVDEIETNLSSGAVYGFSLAFSESSNAPPAIEVLPRFSNPNYSNSVQRLDGPVWLDCQAMELEHPATSHADSQSEVMWLSGKGVAQQGSWPLISRGRLLGWLGIATRDTDAADNWDLQLVGEVASQLSVAVDNAAAYGKIDRLKRQLEQQNVYLREEIRTDHNFGDILGASRSMQKVRHAIRQVAETDSTVLILGETGTGKELIARAIHEQSRRRDKLMVKVNCAALPPNLIASELFGHESGSFTGATSQRIGRFELADGGTIFLDEISEMPLETQVMLLRVLQERVFERVGGSTPIPVNTRVIAATNRDLKTHSYNGHFRDDLYYRLHVFPIAIPPLRDRKEDIAALLDHFVGRFSSRLNKHITRVPRQTMDLLLSYDWPGNVRELENLVERATIVSQGDTLLIDATWLQGHTASGGKDDEPVLGSNKDNAKTNVEEIDRSFAGLQRQAILNAIDEHDGRIYGPSGAAAALGLKPTTLYGKMRKLGIKISRKTSGDIGS
jgi:formate hydrogenlyase transcriptional activator